MVLFFIQRARSSVIPRRGMVMRYRPPVERQHVERQHVEGQHVEGQHVEGHHEVLQHLQGDARRH